MPSPVKHTGLIFTSEEQQSTTILNAELRILVRTLGDAGICSALSCALRLFPTHWERQSC